MKRIEEVLKYSEIRALEVTRQVLRSADVFRAGVTERVGDSILTSGIYRVSARIAELQGRPEVAKVYKNLSRTIREGLR